MDYRVEVRDQWDRRVAVYEEVPLMKAARSGVDGVHTIEGILPGSADELGHGYRVQVWIEGELFLEAVVTKVEPQWSDTKKLILDRFVHFHEVVTFEAERVDEDLNRDSKSSHFSSTVDAIVKKSINSTLGPIHYGVSHTAYPDGSVREYQKLLARKTSGNELEVGGISTGQWVSGARIDTSGAYAKDGDTIAGLVVDGVVWPDLRMMMIDTEESGINSHTVKIHPEVAGWTTAQYEASGYRVRADAATAALQNLMDTKGIDLIELNPHRGATGGFDDRVDLYGRYLGLVYGGGECFNAGLVELGHAEVLLFDDGRFHLPEMELKDFYSYVGVQADTVEAAAQVLLDLDVDTGIFQWLTALGYAAGGYGWSLDEEGCVRFRSLGGVDRVVFYDPVDHALEWTTDSDGIFNAIAFSGNQSASAFTKTYSNASSVAAFGYRLKSLSYLTVVNEVDADAFAAGLLDDVAYAEIEGELAFYDGDARVAVGDVVEVRGEDVRRLIREVDGEWGDRFTGRYVARVDSVTHGIEGGHVRTTVGLTSPLRSMRIPLTAIVKSQPEEGFLFQLRLDDGLVGLDSAFHVD